MSKPLVQRIEEMVKKGDLSSSRFGVLLQRHLQDRVEKWKGILGLQEWTIRLQILGHRSFEGEEMGFLDSNFYYKSAIVVVRDPADFDFESYGVFDIEKTVVHEMVHLRLAMYDFSTGMADADGNWEFTPLQELHLENAVEAMAQGYMDLARESAKPWSILCVLTKKGVEP